MQCVVVGVCALHGTHTVGVSYTTFGGTGMALPTDVLLTCSHSSMFII